MNESAPGLCPVAFRPISVAIKASVPAINPSYFLSYLTQTFIYQVKLMLNCRYNIFSGLENAR